MVVDWRREVGTKGKRSGIWGMREKQLTWVYGSWTAVLISPAQTLTGVPFHSFFPRFPHGSSFLEEQKCNDSSHRMGGELYTITRQLCWSFQCALRLCCSSLGDTLLGRIVWLVKVAQYLLISTWFCCREWQRGEQDFIPASATDTGQVGWVLSFLPSRFLWVFSLFFLIFN